MDTSQDFISALSKILEKDKRYSKEAYLFVRYALDYTAGLLNIQGHVTGQELLEGIKQYALEKYGPMTRFMLKEWGIEKCEDFGNIVFNMVNCGLFGKTKKDSIDDFEGGYEFYEAFEKPFQ